MAKYQILKDFPDTKLLRGQIVESPQWRNLDLLVKHKFLALIPEEEAEEVAEVKETKPKKRSKK